MPSQASITSLPLPATPKALRTRREHLEARGQLDLFRTLSVHRLRPVPSPFEKAAALEAASQFEEAEAAYLAAIEAGCRTADAYTNLGVLKARQGRHADALDHLGSALLADPGHADAHFNLGCLLLEASETLGAAHHFRTCLSIAAGDGAPDGDLVSDAYYNYIVALLASGRYDEAALHAQAAKSRGFVLDFDLLERALSPNSDRSSIEPPA